MNRSSFNREIDFYITCNNAKYLYINMYLQELNVGTKVTSEVAHVMVMLTVHGMRKIDRLCPRWYPGCKSI